MVSYCDVLPTGSKPIEWLDWFDQEPVQALLAALTRRYDFGGLNGAEPSSLLLDWLACNTDEFTSAKLDDALSILIKQQDVDAPDMLPYGSRINNQLWLSITYLLMGVKLDLTQSVEALGKKREEILAAQGSHPILRIRFERLV